MVKGQIVIVLLLPLVRVFMNLHLNAIIYIAIFFCTIALFLLAWPRRKTPGGEFFLFHLICLAIWDLGLFLEAESTTIPTKIFWSQFSYIGLVFVMPLLYLFILAYTTQEKVSPRSIVVLMIIPIIVLAAAWTNAVHHLVWTNFVWGVKSYNILAYGHGIIFYINIVYIYFLVAYSIAVLARAIPRYPPPFKSQLVVILIGGLFPMVSGLMYVFNINLLYGMDISIFGFLVSNLMLAFGFIYYRLLDLVPVANDNVVQNLQDGMIVVDWRHRIVKINSNAERLLSIPTGNYLGQDIRRVFPADFDTESLIHNATPVELELGVPNQRYLDIRSSPLTSNATKSPGTLIILRDITPQKEAEIMLNKANHDLKMQLRKINGLQEQLRDQALHDPLTGLFNYRGMDEILNDMLENCIRQNRPLSILVLDIDHFKRVNDVYGHPMGNFLLQEYGKVIQSSIRKDDFACRFGGDEMILAFQGMPLQIAMTKAEEIREGIKKIEVEKNQAKIFSTVSIGVACYPEHGTSIKELISAADQAMYDAKEKGRDAVFQALSNKASRIS
jgi:diguanylate cyclase (GGDEF)-like protein